ncbi:hypothetical protein HBB16_19735 [Pseudonocardia sp. MCCB 268]|nr:hypothetical protein [Pseudonocardia cytotoxica]
MHSHGQGHGRPSPRSSPTASACGLDDVRVVGATDHSPVRHGHLRQPGAP